MTPHFHPYWPEGQTNQLMKAAFHSDAEIASQAWRSWLETCDFDNALWRDLRIASLAQRRFGRSDVSGALTPRLLGLRRYIWSTAQLKIEAARPLLKEFGAKNVLFMPIKGSVLFARNAHAMTDRLVADIDILIDQASWEKAVNIALSQGWSSNFIVDQDVALRRMRQTHHSFDLQLGANGAVDLHQFSLLLNRQLGADATLWERARPAKLSGIPVLLPHPSDQLAIVFGHCFIFPNPESFDWVADALATISTPGFDWHLFTDTVLDRELAVPAATALTYLAEELRCSIPSVVVERIAGHVCEPFLSEFAVYSRTTAPKTIEESRAIYQAECIRSRRFIGRVPNSPKIAIGESRVTTQPEIRVGQKVVLPMPSGVSPTDRVQFRLLLEVADEWRNASSSALGTSALVVLRCFDNFALELGRLLIRRKQSGPQELQGDIDGSLVVGRGIDELWLDVSTVEPWLYNLRARIVRLGTKWGQEAAWLRKLRRARSLTSGLAKPNTRVPNDPVSKCAILRGSFEATICPREAKLAQH